MALRLPRVPKGEKRTFYVCTAKIGRKVCGRAQYNEYIPYGLGHGRQFNICLCGSSYLKKITRKEFERLFTIQKAQEDARKRRMIGLWSAKNRALIPISNRATDPTFKGAEGFYSEAPWAEKEKARAEVFLLDNREALEKLYGKVSVRLVKV